MRITFLFPAIFLFSWSFTEAQIQFVNRNDMLQDNDIHSAVPVGIADMNGDGLDDIVTLNEGRDLRIQYQTPDPGRPFIHYRGTITLDAMEQNDICIADFNNDGTNDILTVGSYDRVKVLYGIPFTYDLNQTFVDVTPFFSQGASSGDFNHDGWVDVVLLNDNGLNTTLINNGQGTLVDQVFFDFVTVPPSDNSGNYGSVYTDFDMDGDLDFYIAKCRQGVGDPTDPRRINALYVNDGFGHYAEDAANYGLASGRQSWTADFGDIDNDGDLDCFITQHDVVSELFENIDNDTFINITPSSGLIIGGVPLQGMFRDFDNDGFQDILVSGDMVFYYHNNGDKTFTKEEPFGGTIFGTFSLGDLNQDGFTDVYASTVIPFNNPDLLREDVLFLNEPNGNHFLALNLIDTAGNPTAIGAMAMLYGSWGIQTREVRGGEQYGVSSGHKLIFGLKDEIHYDSLVIRWPDGSREVFKDLEVDKHWVIRRGGCKHLPLPLFPQIESLCGEDSLIIATGSEHDLITWSNGSQDDSIVIKDQGLYYAWLNDDGCPVLTQPIEVIINPDTVRPEIIYEGHLTLCDGETALLSVSPALGYQWSSGDTTQSITVLASGDYYAVVEGYCIVQSTDTIHLDFLVSENPVTTSDTFMLGDTAFLYATGDSIIWFSDEAGMIPVGSGNFLQAPDLTDTTTFYARDLELLPGQDYQVGPVSHQGVTKYNASFVNGGLLFDVFEPVIIHQVTAYTDSIGPRIIEIIEGDDVIFQFEVDLVAGANEVVLEVALPVGSYTISTNTQRNNELFGVSNPYLWRSTTGVLYPYAAPGVISINSSTYGEDFYYYFYDWKISTSDKFCYSELVPATAFLDLGVATKELSTINEGLVISPNPSDGPFRLSPKTDTPFQLTITTMDGGIILGPKNYTSVNDIILDLSPYPPAIYLARYSQGSTTYVLKLIRI